MLKKIFPSLRRDYTKYKGITLPPKNFRFGGKHFHSNADFVNSGKEEVRRLCKYCNLNQTSSLLEIGCGPGRLPIGILQELNGIQRYIGIDTHHRSIQWCEQHIGNQNPSFSFLHLDIYNSRYNPAGTIKMENLEIPLEQNSYDIIYLFSVFSHLLLQDVESYLKEFQRLLTDKGKIFLTAFVQENVPTVSENPEGYIQKWEGELHCIRYNKSFFSNLLDSHGFQIEHLFFEKEADLQSGFILSKK